TTIQCGFACASPRVSFVTFRVIASAARQSRADPRTSGRDCFVAPGAPRNDNEPSLLGFFSPDQVVAAAAARLACAYRAIAVYCAVSDDLSPERAFGRG